MTLTRSLLLGCSLALAATAASAQTTPTASTLVEIEGSVMVNQGQEFVSVPSGTKLAPGNRVMAMEGASAIVRYEDGCDLEVKPGTVVTLSDRSPCAGWIPVVETIAPGVALGGAAGAGIGQTVALTAAGVIAVTIIADRLNDDDDEDEPVSP